MPGTATHKCGLCRGLKGNEASNVIWDNTGARKSCPDCVQRLERKEAADRRYLQQVLREGGLRPAWVEWLRVGIRSGDLREKLLAARDAGYSIREAITAVGGEAMMQNIPNRR
jgi:hypothetical protein